MGTGGNWYYLNSKISSLIWTDLQSWTSSNSIIIAGSTSNATSGIVANHAYTLLNVYSVAVSTTTYQLIKLRNPWGMTEWSGAFGDTDPFWAANPSIATQVGFANKNDGDLFISLSDFLNPNYFNFIT